MAHRRSLTPIFDPHDFQSPSFTPSFDMDESHQTPTFTPAFDLDESHQTPTFDFGGSHRRSLTSMASRIPSITNDMPSGDGMFSNSYVTRPGVITDSDHSDPDVFSPGFPGIPSRAYVSFTPDEDCMSSEESSPHFIPNEQFDYTRLSPTFSVPSRANVSFPPEEDYMKSEESYPRFTPAEHMPYFPDQNMASDYTTLISSSQNKISTLASRLSNLSTTDDVSPTTTLDNWDPVPFHKSHNRLPILHPCDDHVHDDSPEWRPSRPCTYEPIRPKLITLPFRSGKKSWKWAHGERSCRRADEGRILRRHNNRFNPLSSLSKHRPRIPSPPRDDNMITHAANRPLRDRTVRQFEEEMVEKYGECGMEVYGREIQNLNYEMEKQKRKCEIIGRLGSAEREEGEKKEERKQKEGSIPKVRKWVPREFARRKIARRMKSRVS